MSFYMCFLHVISKYSVIPFVETLVVGSVFCLETVGLGSRLRRGLRVSLILEEKGVFIGHRPMISLS